jgi:mannosyltransferase
VAPRTLAGKAAATLREYGNPAETVVYCPDQLGPDVARLLPGWYLQEIYPTGAFPARVDWVDYAARNWLSSPGSFAATAVTEAGNQPLWLLDAPDFASYYGRCGQLAQDLSSLRPSRVVFPLGADPMTTSQHEVLIEYLPTGT